MSPFIAYVLGVITSAFSITATFILFDWLLGQIPEPDR